MWTAGYKYSWGKMEAAAQDRAGVNIFRAEMAQPPRKNWPVCKWSVAYVAARVTRHKSSQVTSLKTFDYSVKYFLKDAGT